VSGEKDETMEKKINFRKKRTAEGPRRSEKECASFPVLLLHQNLPHLLPWRVGDVPERAPVLLLARGLLLAVARLSRGERRRLR